MKILSFESTCDETAVAVVEDGRKLLTDQIFSQADLHAVYGGVGAGDSLALPCGVYIHTCAEGDRGGRYNPSGHRRGRRVVCAGAYRRRPCRCELCQILRPRAECAAHTGAPYPRPYRGKLPWRIRSWSRRSCALPYPAATLSLSMSAATPICTFLARRAMTRRGSASIRPRVCWDCRTPAESR